MVSFALNGVGVSGGIAIGRAQLVSHATLEVAHYTIPGVEGGGRDRALHQRGEGGPEGARGPARRDDQRRRARRVRSVPRRALDDPQRSHAVGDAEEDHPRAALQRGMGAHAADGRARGAVRPDRGHLPARAQGRHRAGVRARAEAADGQAGAAAHARRRRADDPRRARPVARRRDPVQASPLRRVPDRRRRRHVAHGHRRAQPERAGGGRDAQRALAHPRQRAPDRRRRLGRGDHQSRSRGAGRVSPEAERDRAFAAEAEAAAHQARRHHRRRAHRPLREHRAARRPRANGRERRDGRWALSLRVPVPQPRRAALGGRAVRGVPCRGRGHGRTAGHGPHVRPGRRQADRGLRRPRPRRAESGAGIARGPLLPRRAAHVHHAASRHPARVALRQGAHPGADARVVERDRPDARRDRAGEGEPQGPGRAVRRGAS